MTAVKEKQWSGDTTFFNFTNIDDELFDEMLIKLAVSSASRTFTTDILNVNNVYDRIDCKDGDKSNLRRDNLIMMCSETKHSIH